MTDSSARQLFPKFVLVGTVGFLVDAVLLQTLFSLGHGPFVARLFSAFIAMTATWYLNRTLVFRSSSRRAPEYLRHLAAQSVGMLINLLVYVGLLLAVPELQDIPLLALVAGSLVALIFNFFSAKLWTFRNDT